MIQAFDITGVRYGRLVALRRGPRHPRYGQARWVCRCDCGVVAEQFGYLLWHGKVKSCGCLAEEKRRSGDFRRTHGLTRTPEHVSWCSMRRRCTTPTDAAYPDYGGRGITVCERWEAFDAFLADMGPRPPGTTLDRIDNDGPYAPWNCRWIDRKGQVRNRRTTHFLEHGGERLSHN